jgi:hypothetical protein
MKQVWKASSSLRPTITRGQFTNLDTNKASFKSKFGFMNQQFMNLKLALKTLNLGLTQNLKPNHTTSCYLMSLCHLPYSLLTNRLTSCYWLMAFTPWSTWSLPIPLKQIWFHVLLYLSRWPQWWWLKQRKDFTTINTWQMHFFSPCHKGSWLSPSKNRWFFSLMY